ncbi:DUF89 family protein [bacterium]|nr:MAG: DUF89 family protein [bacterium]
MKIHPDCYPCLLRQMEMTARASGAGPEDVLSVRSAAVQALRSLWNDDDSPPAVSAPLYLMAGEICESDDPFLPQKIRYTIESLKLLPLLNRLVREAADSFEAAVRISIAGNVIDFGTGGEDEVGDLETTLMDYLSKPFFRDNVKELKKRSGKAERILYLGDNAGETVFDRPLLSLLPARRVIYAAKDGPIINDATVADARLAGIHLHARLISTGARTPGTILETCSKEFLELYRQADLIISKGQGNFETLTEEEAEDRIFMLFTVKCSVAADFLGAEMGDMVVMKH